MKNNLILKNTVNQSAEGLYRIFWSCFLALSVLIFICLPLQYLLETFGDQPNFIFVVLIVFLLFSVVFFIAHCASCSGSEEQKKHRFIWMPTILFLFALALRVVMICVVGRDTVQVSDFMGAFQTAIRPIPVKEIYYAIFSNWGMYSAYLKTIFQLFGASEITGIVANVFLESVSVVLIYYIMLLTIKSQRVVFAASMAALLYAVWPAQLGYLVLLTPEFVHIFLLLLSMLFLCLGERALECQQIARQRLWGLGLGYTLAAITLSFSGFFKSVDKIMLCAIAIAAVILWGIRFRCDKKTEGDTTASIKRIPVRLISSVLLVVVYSVSNFIGFSFLNHYIGYSVNRNPLPHYLNTGISSDSRGSWNAEVAGEYIAAVVEHNFIYEQAGDLINESIKRDIAENKHLTPGFFYYKIVRAYQGQNYLEFSVATIDEKSRPVLANPEFSIFAQTFYLLVGSLMVLGCWVMAKARPNRMLFCAALFILGFMLLLLLSENQPRYKIVSYPYMCMLAGIGGQYAYEFVVKRRKPSEKCK